MFFSRNVQHKNDKNNFECETSEQAFEFINDFIATEAVTKLKINIYDNSDGFNNYDLDDLKEKFVNNSLVILLSSNNKKKFFVYWKLKDSQEIRSLKPYNENFVAKDEHLCEYVANFLIDSLKAGHLGIHKDVQVIDYEVQLHSLYDIRNYNLLLLAAESGTTNPIDALLDYGIETQSMISHEEVTAQDLALKGQHWEALQKLLLANLSFPTQIVVDKCSKKLRRFIKTCEEFHEMIELNNQNRLAAILREYPNLIYFYNLSNKSALKTALDLRLIEMYEFLISKNLSFAPHEDTDLIWGQLDIPQRVRLHKINQKYLGATPESQINILMSNTSIIHDGIDTNDKLNLIRQAYNALNSDHRLKVIMKVVSNSKLFRMVFDFNCDVTSRVKPILFPQVNGKINFLSGRIIIGAKQLLDQEAEDETLKMLISELCYYASKVPYESLSALYTGRIQQSILDDNPEVHQPSELVSPQPLLTSLFDRNPEIPGQISMTFNEICHAYLNVFVPKEKVRLRRDEGKRKEKVKQIFSNNYSFIIFLVVGIMFGFLLVRLNSFNIAQKSIKKDQDVQKSCKDKIITTKDPQIAFLESQVHFEWKNLNKGLREKFLNSNLNFQGKKVKFSQVYKLYPEAFNALTSEQIISVLNGKELKVGNELESESKFYIERKFIPEDASLIDFENSYGHEYVDDLKTREKHEKSRTESINFQDFYNDFVKKSFEQRDKILKKVKENHYFRKVTYNINHEAFHFLYKSTNEILSKITNERLLILSSESGAGKTTTLEQLAMLAKSKFPIRLILYIDLTTYVKLYDSNLNAKNLIRKILELDPKTNKFEVDIFEKLFQTDELILVWDGFDKISQDRSKFIFTIFKSIYKNTKNIQLISTGFLNSDQLKNEFKIVACDLVPFDESEKHEFIKNVFISNNYLDKNIEENIKKVKKICKDLHYENLIINNPLMLKLIAETYESQNGNIYGIFEKLIETKIDLWLENSKNSFSTIKKLLFGGSLKSIFQKYALLNEFYIFTSATLGFKLRKLQIMQQNIPKNLSIKEFSSLGILTIHKKNNFKFIHETISDFFVAQYFIENIFNTESVDNDEAELRLELFFELSQMYEYKQKIITDFMMSYLQMRPQDSKKFNPIISRLLRTKFKNFFIRMLHTNHPKIFEFLFEFFKLDHDLLVDLLHVHEPETFYTAIFNPNYFALFVDPEEIKALARNFLTDKELSKFLTGENQKGKILFGIHFYSLLEIKKSNSALVKEINSLKGSNFWEFFDKINKKLAKVEQKKLFVAAMSPKIYLYYDKMFSAADFAKYEKLWENYENYLTTSEMADALGDALIFYIEIFPGKKHNHESFLAFFLKKTDKFLSKSQIFEMFLNKNILHEAQWDQSSFQTLWNFVMKNTIKEEQKRILLQDDNDDKNFYFYYRVNEMKQKFSSYTYSYFYYDFTPFKIIHRTFAFIHIYNIDFVDEMYTNYFNKSEIQNIFTSSNDFLPYAINIIFLEKFEKFTFYLEELFKSDKNLLKSFLEKKIEPTDLSIFEFFDEFKGLPHSDLTWFEKLKILRELYEKL